jgi:alkylhydroperoxidase family enzyme
MAHIELPDGIPGITGPMMKYPETAQHLRGLAEALMRGPSSLTLAERELIATYVSAQNNCHFCTKSHQPLFWTAHFRRNLQLSFHYRAIGRRARPGADGRGV